MPQTPSPRLATYGGVALVSMAALANEINLTRIFSVTLFYHFAFSAISIALLGSGAAGVWLHLSGRRLAKARHQRLLVWLSLGFSVALLAAFRLYTLIPVTFGDLNNGLRLSGQQVGYLALIYPILTLPYLLVGAVLALALTRYQASAGRIYFADLAGAGLGCVLIVGALNAFGGAGSVLVVGLVAALGAVTFALADWQEAPRPAGRGMAPLVLSAMLAAGLAAGLLIQRANPWFALPVRHTYDDRQPLYEAWNAYSRITVYEDQSARPFGWGTSRVFLDSEENTGDPGRYLILIDEKAGTPILQYSGVPREPWYQYLRWDLTALPYYLREEPDVFVIGPGGGKDVVTAYEFGAGSITGVELNPLIVNLVMDDYAEYSGHIYHSPIVNIVVDDARTYLAGSDERFDIIQASLIDTLAASSAGAFALSENGIYTREAFFDYYDHLKDDGLVNFSRWYFPDGPAETLRLVVLGMDAWQRAGVEDPSQHVIVIGNLDLDMLPDEGLAGMLLKKTPFTVEEIEAVRAVTDRMGFTLLYAPGLPGDNEVSDFITAADRQTYIQDYPLDISPPTDDRPFFFGVVRLSDLGQSQFAGSAIYRLGAQAELILAITLGLSGVLAVTMIMLPLVVARRETLARAQGGTLTYIVFFAALGLAFISVEVPMVQRLSIYLGSPTYSLVVVLFALLVSSGLGSLASQRVPQTDIRRSIRGGIGILLGLLVVYTPGLPALLGATQSWTLALRIVLAVAALVPLGLLMGRPFPLALRHVGAREEETDLLPWLWATNSALSVVASAMTVVVAIHYGFSRAFLIGIGAYALALFVVMRFKVPNVALQSARGRG